MAVEEMIIQLRATAEGVKQGVSAAKASLKELQKEHEKLKTEIELKVNSEGVKRLKTDLSELQKQKQELQQTITFAIGSEDLKVLREDLDAIQREKQKLESKLSLEISVSDKENAQHNITILDGLIKNLKDQIDIQVQTDAENAKMALKDTEKQIASIERNIQIEIEESGANALSSRLKTVDADIKSVTAANDETKESLSLLSSVAKPAFDAILSGVKTGLDTFNEYSSAMDGLSSQMEHLGINVVDAMSAVQEISAGGLISPADAAASIKNLTAYGYTLEAAKKYTQALADTAVYNRQSQYSVSEAVRITTEGIKNENAALSEAAGMTKNTSAMYAEYAQSIGKTASQLTQAEKMQATLTIGMAEMAANTGNAAEYLKTLGGAQDALKVSTGNLAAAYGEALAPVVQTATTLATGLIDSFTGLLQGHQSITAGVTATGLAFTGYIVVLKTLTVAIGETATATKLLDIALKGITGHPVIAALSVAAGVIIGVVTAIKNAKKEAEEYAEKMDKLNEKVEEYSALSKQGITNENAETFKNMNAELAENYNVFSQVVDAYTAELDSLKNTGTAEEFWWINTENFASDKFGELKTDVEELTAVFGAFGVQIDVTKATYDELVAAGEQVNQQLQEQNAQISQYDEKQKSMSTATEATKKSVSDYASEINKLSSIYETLSKKEDLSVDSLLELIQLYPSVAKEIAENGVQRERLAEIIQGEMQASREAAIQELKDKKAALEAEKERVTSALKGLEAEAQTAAMSYGDIKRAEKDLVEAHRENFNAMQENRLSNASTKTMGLAVQDSWQKLIDDIDAAIQETEGQINALEQMPLYNSAKATQQEKETTSELQKQLQLLEDQKATKEMSLKDEVKGLEEIARLYAKTDAEKLEMKKMLYAKGKELADKQYTDEMAEIEKLNKDRADNTDFTGMIKAYEDFAVRIEEIYAKYPETMQTKLDEVNDRIIEKTRERTDSVAGIEKSNVEKVMGIYDSYIGNMKKFNGMTYGVGDEAKEFKFGAAEEKVATEKFYQAIEADLDSFISTYGENTETMTNEQKALYEYLLQLKADYTDKLVDLSIAEIKEMEAANEKEAEMRIKAIEKLHKDIIALEKEKTKAITDEIKSRYNEEIKIAEEAANAEIAVYEDKIKAIDDLLKAEERREADENHQDKMNRLKETLKFETDDSNKYELQKEMDNLTAENTKRKYKEGLQDEKASYQDEINLIKDNLSEQKKILQEKRDAEVAIQDEALNAYTQKLADELDALQKNNELSLEELKKNLEEQTKGYNEFLDEKETKTNINNAKIEELMNNSTTTMVNKLLERVSEYATAGREAGNAYADAFNSAVASIMASTSSYSASVSAKTASAAQGSSVTTNTVQLYQSINTPTASPAKMARESKKALETAVRYL